METTPMLYRKTIDETVGMDKVKKVVVSLSGGLDSTILLYLMVKAYGKENVTALSLSYNQRHGDVELFQAKKSAQKLGVVHHIFDLSSLGKIASNFSSMVKGSVATPTMEDVLGDPQPSCYVPGRNLIIVSLLASIAESIGAEGIVLGINPRMDGYLYFDCSHEFIDAAQKILNLNRKNQINLITPLDALTKTDIVLLGQELGVDFSDTFTCYDPKISGTTYVPCGVCPACFPRKAGFEKAGVKDTLVSVTI
jgi:7-cyano-7-deazaguanine synthase